VSTPPTVFLFDIDGTLISSGGAGRRAMRAALGDAAHGASFSFAGMTDRLIVRQALEGAGAPTDEGAIDAVIERYLARLSVEVADEAIEYLVHIGMTQALDTVAGQESVAVGLGTGNVERGARIKLSRVALNERFGFGGFGCDAEDRAELIRIGADRGAARLGVGRSACRVVVIGDTPRDITAARAIGAEVVAVATGTVDLDVLAEHDPDHLFPNLAHRGALKALLGPSA